MYLRELKEGLIHLFYPHLCEGCSKPLTKQERVLCIGCEALLPETGHDTIADNDAAMRFAGRVPFMKAASFAYFTNDGLLQHMVHGLKYNNKQDIGLYLGEHWGRRLMASGWVGGIDVIVPVPLHPAKLAKRGYNQSLLIAQGISEATGIPVHDKLLLRTRNTETQTNKTRTERVNNMSGAFAIAAQKDLAGKHILLCDDILTTGATMESCAVALQAEKSVKISLTTIGIAIS